MHSVKISQQELAGIVAQVIKRKDLSLDSMEGTNHRLALPVSRTD